MANAPEGLTFNADERRLFLFLMGEEPPEAVPQKVYGLAEPFYTLDHELASLPTHYASVAAGIEGALPDQAVAQFKGMLGDLMGTYSGVSRIDEIRNAARLMGEQVESWGRSLLSAQVQILSTLIALEIQLDIMAAMAFFTGGATAGEEALLQAEARLTLSTIMDHLLALLRFALPTAIQATIGALIMMAASLVSNALGGGDPEKPGINWEWVGAGALGGALADIGIRGIGGLFDKAIGDALKRLDNKYLTELTNIGGDFLKMGGGSAIAATLTGGITTGQWQLAPMMFVGGGIGGAAMNGIGRGLHVSVAKYRMMKIDPDTFRELTSDLRSVASSKDGDLGGSDHVADRDPGTGRPGLSDTIGRRPTAFTRPPDASLTSRTTGPRTPASEKTFGEVPADRSDPIDPFTETVERPPGIEPVLPRPLTGPPPVLQEAHPSILEPPPPAEPLNNAALRPEGKNPPVSPETPGSTRQASLDPPTESRPASGEPRTTPLPPRTESGSTQHDRPAESGKNTSEHAPPESVRTESGTNRPRPASVEDVPDEGEAPTDSRSPAAPESGDPVTGALADVRAKAEERDTAYLDFERRLAAHPDHGLAADAPERVASLREWFADQRTGEPAGRSDLDRRLTQRLEAARAASEVDRAFDREVVSAAPKTRGREYAGFLDGERVAALREDFVRAMTDPGLTADARTGRVEEFRREYARAEQEWRDRTSAEAITEPGHRVEEMAARRAPNPDWAPEVRSWYRNEQAALAERTAALLRGRRFDAEHQARLESDLSQRLDALHDVADRRNLAHQEFSHRIAGQKIGEATLRSPAAVEWAARRIDTLREEYVRERLADVTAQGDRWEYVAEPPRTEPGDWRVPAWWAAQARLHTTYDGVFARHDTEVADRRAVDEIFESWLPETARKLPPEVLAAIRDHARQALDLRTRVAGVNRQEVLDALPGELDLEAARQVALQHGRDAYQQTFDSWRRPLGDTEEWFARSDTVREGERETFERAWNAAVREIFADVSDVRGDLPRNMRAATARLRELTGGLWDAFDRRARYESELERFGELFSDAERSFTERPPESARALLAAFEAETALPSEPGRREVRLRAMDELDAAYAELFPAGEEVTAEVTGQWQARFDAVVASLPGRLALQVVREVSLIRAWDDAGAAIESWRTRPPALGEAFRRAFGVTPGGEPPVRIQESLKAALARSVNDRFGEVFAGVGGERAIERLDEWHTAYGEIVAEDRVHTRLAVEIARQGVAGTTERTFAEWLADWRQAHPEFAPSGDDVMRTRTGLVERTLSLYDEVFGVRLDKPEDLNGRMRIWEEGVARLAADLPAHLVYETTVPAALKGAGRSFGAVSEGRGQDDVEWLDRTAHDFHEGWIDEHRTLWAPPDLSASWSEREAGTTDAFGAGRAETRSATGPPAETATRAVAKIPAESPMTRESGARLETETRAVTVRETGATAGPREGDGGPVLRPAGAGSVPVPVADPGNQVATPASRDEWMHRRVDAPVVSVRTERFDPTTTFLSGAGPEEGGWEADIRFNVQRIQATGGQWVRYQVAVLPVKPMPGVAWEDVESLTSRLNEALDAYTNRGYELTVHKDQLHLAVKLVYAPEHPRAVEVRPGVTKNGPGFELDTRHWGLEDYIYALVHEVLHYFGLPDEYLDRRSLLRGRATSSAVKADGLMAGGVFDPAQPMPARYLRILEAVVDATAVLVDHPLPREAADPATGVLADPAAETIVGPADDVAVRPGPPAPNSREVARRTAVGSSVASSSAAPPPLAVPRNEVVEAYAEARTEFRLPNTYRLTPSHAAAVGGLRRLAGPEGDAPDWAALANRVNRGRRQNAVTDAMNAVLPADLPGLLSAGRLAYDVHGPGFTADQLRDARRLAGAMRSDPDTLTNVLHRAHREPGDEVTVRDLRELVHAFGGYGPAEYPTVADVRMVAALVAEEFGSGPLTVGALRTAWETAAGMSHAEARTVLSEAVLATVQLEPSFAVIGPATAGPHRTELAARLGRLRGLAESPWRPNQRARVERFRDALREVEEHIDAIHTAAVRRLEQQIRTALAGPPRDPAATDALRRRLEEHAGHTGPVTVHELLAIRSEAALLRTPDPAPPDDHAGPSTEVPEDTPPRPPRRLPGRIRYAAQEAEEADARFGLDRSLPWGEWGHVARIGDVRSGEDRRLAAQIAALLPAGLRGPVEDGVVAAFKRLGGEETGRRLASPAGLRVSTPEGPVTVRLGLGPLIGEGGARYRRPEEVQSVQIGARPSQALDLPQILTPSTFTGLTDSRSIAPESLGDGPISIATGSNILPNVGVMPTVTGKGARGFGAYEGAVIQTVKQIWRNQYAYFEVPANEDDPGAGSHWSVTFPGEDGPETVVRPADVLLAFAEDDSPLDEDAAPVFGPERALPDEHTTAMAKAFHGVLWRANTITQSLVVNRGPEAVARRIIRRFPDAGTAFHEAVTDLFTESGLFRVNKDVLGHGYLSEEFRINEDTEDWAAFRLRGRMTAVQRIDTAKGYVQQDARHLFWSGESSSITGGVASGLALNPGPPTFTIRGVPVQLVPTGNAGAAGSVTRSLAASTGAGDWRYGAYPSDRRVYRLTANLHVDVRSSRAAAARPTRFALTAYVEVPEREADRFERELNDVLAGPALEAGGRTIVPADGDNLTDRMPPLGVLKGRSRGPSVPDLLGGFEDVVSRAMTLIDEAFGDTRLTTVAPGLTSRQRHRLERMINQRFAVAAALAYSSQLISHRMSFTRLYQVPGGRLRLKVGARSQQSEDWTGSRLEWGRIDHYPISYSDLGAGEQVADQLGYRGGGKLRLGPLYSALRSLSFSGQFNYGRSHSALLTARSGVWSSLGFVYEGPVRFFLFGTRYHVDVELTFEPEFASGGTVAGLAGGTARRAVGLLTGTPQRGLPTRTIRRHDDWAGIIRYMVAEGLSPLTGGHSLPRSPATDLGRALSRRPPVAPVTFADLWGWAAGPPERIHPDDQPLEVLGVEELVRVAGRLLQDAGIPPETYSDTLDVTINEDQLIGRMMWGGPVVQASGTVHGGTAGDRHAVISLRGRVLRLRRQAGDVTMSETDIMDSEPAMVFTGKRSTSHTLSGAADLGGGIEDGGPYGSWTFRNVTDTRFDSYEVLSGRWLTQENREYRPHRGTMLWDVVVKSWSANALGSWSVSHDRMQVLVVGGLLLLRPQPQAPVTRPAGVPERLRLERLPLAATSDRLDWQAPQYTPDGLNPVLNMVRGVLRAVDEQLLYREWRVVGGRSKAMRSGMPTTLHTILEYNALLGHRDTLMGPGLILHLARSLAGASEQVTLILRAEERGTSDESADYTYLDTRARDFALYRLNTQRRVLRHGTTSAYSVGANAGTSRMPAYGDAVAGTYLEGTAEGDHYEQMTIAKGEIFRTRDVLTILGDTDGYTGGLRITATVHRGYTASKALQVLTFGLADPGLALFVDPNRPVPVAVTDSVDIVERTQFPASMRPGRSPDLAPVAERVHRLVSAATPEQVLTNAERTPFPVEGAEILSRGVVPVGIEALALRRFFDLSIAVFTGMIPADRIPAVVRSLMTATGIPFEAYAGLLSRHQFITSFHLTLDDGHTYPSLVREDGPATDARGEVFLQTRFYNPRSLGWVEARLTSESLHMAENGLLDAAGTTLSVSLDSGPALAPPGGNPSIPVEPSGSLGQSHDHGGTAGERLVRPIVFRRHVHYLRVEAGVLAGPRVTAVNERRDIRYGAGESQLWYAMDDTVELLLDPETALAKRILFGSEGIPGLDGRRYLPYVPAVAPPRGGPAAAGELNRLRAALGMPRYGDWYMLAGHYEPATRQVILSAMREDAETGRPVIVTERLDADAFSTHLTGFDDLGDRPVALVMGGVDLEFATAVARRTGHDLLITLDDIRQDHDLHAVGPDGPGHWLLVPAGGADPTPYGASMETVLTSEIIPRLRGARVDDEPGTMYPDPAVHWRPHRDTPAGDQDAAPADGPPPPPPPPGDETGRTSPALPLATPSDGALVELPVLPEPDEPLGSALARALDVTRVPGRAGTSADTPPATHPYDRLMANLTDKDLPDSTPLIHETAQVHLHTIERAGIPLTAVLRTQATLQNDHLTVSSLDLDRPRRFRLTLAAEPLTRDVQAEMIALLDAAARHLGVRLVLGEAGPPVAVGRAG